jgi:hypothetical protein
MKWNFGWAYTPRLAAACALVAISACDQPQALGDANAVIIAVPEEQWPQIQADVESALEPRAFTVRDERIFRVTPVDPEGPYWGDTRRFRQVLLVGEPGDPWIAEALRKAGQQPAQLPGVVEARNVWARGQRVIALVVPPGASATAVRPLLPEIGQTMLSDYHEFVQRRMFASGADTARAAALQREAGFTLLMPTVYRTEQPDPNTYLFVNDQPDPARLQRVVTVTWRPADEIALTPGAVLAWREEVAQRYYNPPQLTDVERTGRGGGDGAAPGVQVQGVWSSPPGAWPAAGPFVARAHTCEDGRVFLLDGWVYAPGVEKYEYLVQVHTIMESFRCGGAQRVG